MSMLATFAGVTCPNNQPVHKVCVTEDCKFSPFLCLHSDLCKCQDKHGKCCIKSVEELDKNIKTILKFQFFIIYSPEFKGKSISVAGRFAIQTKPPPTNQRFVLTYDSVPLQATETVSFRLTKVRGCVGVGVFIRQVLQKNEYRYIPDAKFLNHGCYMLLSNNLLYSHSRPSQNGNQIKKFEVNANDIIKVRYSDHKVTFISKFLEENLHVDVREGEHLHFGVYLYDVEDEVEIVNTFVHGE